MSSTKHLIFVNENIDLDYNILANSLDGSEIFTIDNNTNGLTQIGLIASKYSNIDSIQIVSHGGDGSLDLGNISLSESNINSYSDVLGGIGESLSDTGDVLLYGCDVASTENGKGFVLGLSKKLGAEVGASIDLTGSKELGGDVDLEFKTGTIETKTIDLNPAFVDAETVLASITTMGADALKSTSTGGAKVTYLEMRNILEEAAKGGITAQEFTDLKQIYKDSESAFENNWVKYISHSAINGHVANKYWVGGVKLKSQIQEMGNMKAGSTELHANRLIAKWFKGEDLPMPVSGGDTANPSAAAALPGYVWTQGTLFKADITTKDNAITNQNDGKKIPSINKSSGGKDNSSFTPGVLVTADDVNQGSAGTCYFMAVIGAVAHQESPDMKVYTGDAAKAGKLIEAMFVDPFAVNNTDHAEKGKVYGLKFLNFSGQEVWTTVNAQLPATSLNFGWNNTGLYQRLKYAGNKESFKTYDDKGWYWYSGSTGNIKGETWVGLMEKGYVQVTNQIMSWRSNPEKYPMSYAATEGGNGWSFKHVVNAEYTRFSGHDGYAKYSNIKDLKDSSVKTEFINMMKAKGMAAIGSDTSTAYNPATGKVMWNEYDHSTGKYKWYSPDGSGGKTYDSSTGLVGKYDIPTGTQKQLYASHMHMVLDYDASSDMFLVKNPHSGIERAGKNNEWWVKMEDLSNKYISSDIWITDPVASPKVYSYTISSTADKKSKAVDEGGKVTFTITRNDIGSDSLIYIHTLGKDQGINVKDADNNTLTPTADKNDFKATDGVQQLKFSANEKVKTIVVETYKDASAEGSGGQSGYETFGLGLVKNITSSTPDASAAAWVKDVTPKNYQYEILSNSGTSDTAIKEGGKITFTIKRPLLGSDEASTVYLTTRDGDTESTDYEGLDKHKLDFTAFESEKKVYIKTHKDASDDTGEYFTLNLYKGLDNTGNVADATKHTAKGYIKDEAAPNYSYTVTSDAGDPKTAKSEGEDITFFITRSNAGTESKVYLSTIDNTAIAGVDYIEVKQQELVFKANQKQLSYVVKTKADANLENTEAFDLGVYNSVKDKVPLTTGSGYIKDAVFLPDYYELKQDSINASVVDAIVASGTISNKDSITVKGSATTSLDGGKFISITSAKDESVKFTVKGKAPDGTTDVTEIIDAKQGIVYGTKVFKTVTSVTSNKTTTGNVSLGVFDGIDEGKEITFTVTRDNKYNKPDSVFISTNNATAKDGDFESLDKFEVKFQSFQNSKTFTIKTNSDSETDDNEYFSVDLFMEATSDQSYAHQKVYINDVAVPTTHTYTVTNNSSVVDAIVANGKISDKDNISIKADATNSLGGGKFISITSAKDESVEFTVKGKAPDGTTDITEVIDAKKGIVYGTKAFKTITSVTTDKTTTGDVSLGVYGINEGNDIVFTINRATSGSNKTESTVFIKTLQGKANEDDFTELDITPVTFSAKEDIKTVSVKTKTDKVTDDNEDFVLLLFTSNEDAKEISKYNKYSKAFIKDVAAAKDYKYTVTSDSSYSNPAEENGVITFTINRFETDGTTPGKGTVSTIYTSTTENTAGEKDYKAIKAEALKFESHQTTKIVKVETTADTIKEGRESFYFDLFDTIEDANSGNFKSYTKGYITDSTASTKATYSYQITSTHSDKADNTKWVKEGEAATFTVKRIKDTGSGDDVETSVFIKTNDGTAFTGTDFQGLDGYEIKFNASENNVGKEFTVTTNTDTDNDDGEDFFVSLFKSKADYEAGEDIAAHQVAYIKNDSSGANSVADYSYAITTDSGSSSAAKEGEDITFTITRTLAGGKTAAKSSVFVSTTLGSTDSSDIEVLKNKKLTFKKDETVKTVKVKTKLDTITESQDEYFWFDLFKTKAAAKKGDYDSYVTAYIQDNDAAKKGIDNYDYTVTTTQSSADKAASEGEDLTFVITRTLKSGKSDSDTAASTVYISTTDASAVGGDDFEAINIQEIKFKKDATGQTTQTKVIKVNTNFDKSTEGSEMFYLDLFKTKSGAEAGNFDTYATGYIKDNTSAADGLNNYTYTIESVNAGANLAYDASKAVKEGDEAVFIIKRTLKDGKDAKEGTVYVSTEFSSASANDFEGIELGSENSVVKFKADETEKIIKVKALVDEKTESEEKFNLNLYKTKADAKLGKIEFYGSAYIKDDTSLADAYNYTYTITSSTANSGAAVKEGEDIKFTIARSKIDNSKADATSRVYVTTTESSADSTDYDALDKFAVQFNPTETSKDVIVKTTADINSEGTESFFFDLFTTFAKAKQGEYETYSTGYIKDPDAATVNAINDYTYAVTTSNGYSSPADEGTDLTFTVTRTLKAGKTAAASTLFVKTTESSATKLDYDPIDENSTNFELKFAKDDLVKTITVKSKIDDVTDDMESFFLDLFLTKGDAKSGNFHAYATGYIKENANAKVANDIYEYKIDLQQLEPTEEGNDVVFIITRSLINANDASKGTSSTVYWNTFSGNADETDYDPVKLGKIEFLDKNDNTKEVKVSTIKDKLTEGTETFAIELYKTLADAEEENFHTYQKGQIKDPSVVDNAVYSYTITSDSNSSSSAKEEGSELTVTVTRTLVSGTEADSVLYLNTTTSSASKDDFEFFKKKELKFSKTDKTETVKIKLTQDSLNSENVESFYLDLFETKADAENGSFSKILNSTKGKGWDTAYIKNKANAADSVTYNVTTNSAKSNPKKEGEVVDITMSNPSLTPSTIYATATGGTASSSDYFIIPSEGGTIQINGKTFYEITWTDTDKANNLPNKIGNASGGGIALVADKITESTDEYFYIELYKSKADAENGKVYKSAPVYIKDVVNNYTYTVTEHSSSDAVAEGQDITIDVVRAGSGPTHTVLYAVTFDDSAKAGSDYTNPTIQELEFTSNGKQSFTIKTLTDSVDEGDEKILIGLYDTPDAAKAASTKGVLSTTDQGYVGKGNALIKGTKSYDYTLAPKASNYQEGEKVEFEITRDSSSGSSTMYVSTWNYNNITGYTSPGTDHDKLDHFAVNFKDGETKYTLIIDTVVDDAKDGPETLYLVHSKTKGNNDYVGKGYAYTTLKNTKPKNANENEPTEKFIPDVYGNEVKMYGGSSGDTTITVTSATKTNIPGKSNSMFFNDYAFAAKTASNEVITWGNSTMGGDSSAVKSNLKDVTNIYSNTQAFAVIKSDGSVVTWGNSDAGGNSSSVASDLNGVDNAKDVTKIASTQNSFAALRKDGSVITWGAKSTGGEGTKNLADTIASGVSDIYANMSAFAALKADGSVATWGYSTFGGVTNVGGDVSKSVANKISNTSHSDFVKTTDISSTGSAFAAIREDGSVVTWGNATDGGDSSSVASLIDGDTNSEDVVQVYATTSAFAAIRKNGSVISWGDTDNGGNTTDVASSVNGTIDVVQIFSTNNAFAALRSDGSVVTWGDKDKGGDSSAVASDLNGTVDVSKIYATNNAFAALRTDGKVVTWGYGSYGGDSSSVTSLIDGSLDDDVLSVDAKITDGNLALVGGNTITFTNPQSVVITSAADESTLTFTVKGTDGDGNALTGTVKGANKGVATVLVDGKTSTAYFKTVESIKVDGNTTGNVKAGVVDKTVQTIISTDKAFAALRADGSVVAWGDTSGGGNTAAVNNTLVLGDSNAAKVTQLYASSAAFSAIKSDGSVVAWGDTDRGGSTAGVDFSSAGEVKGMSGESSGVDCTVISWKDVSKKVSSANLKFYKDGTGSAVSGDFITDTSGKISLTGLSGKYSAGFKAATDSTTVANVKKAVNIDDIMLILKDIGKVSALSSKAKVSADINTDTKVNIDDIMSILKVIGGVTKHSDLQDQFVLRDSNSSDPFSSATFDVGGGSLNLNCFLLGDVDGSYYT